MSRPEFERLKRVTVADVLKAGRPAAVLDRREGDVRFVYRAAYRAADAAAVATTLPVSDLPTTLTGGALPPFFSGLLPEGRRLSGLRRAVKTSADDELSLLLAVGGDTVGDVQIVPEGGDADRPASLLSLGGDLTSLRFADVLGDAGVVDRVGLAGVQDKASARMISLPVSRAGERYLLKVEPPEFPHVIENEAYFLDLARRVGLPAAHAQVIRDADDRPGLLVRRFDRLPHADGNPLALACEDACQVLNKWPADKYALSAEDVVVGLAAHCAARPVALRDLFRQFVFAWLSGNGDLHAKNLSIVRALDGEWRVSPAYDVPATVPYGDSTLALPVQGRTTGVSRRHWLAFAAAIGLTERAAVRVLDDLLTRLADLGGQLRGGVLPLPQRAIADWVAELRHRHRITRA